MAISAKTAKLTGAGKQPVLQTNSLIQTLAAALANGPQRTPVVAEVKRAEGAITVPPEISYVDAAHMLMAKAEAEEEQVDVRYTFPEAFPWEGALAFQTVLDRKYGGFGANAVSHKVNSFFGSFIQRPDSIQVNVGVGQVKSVAWGKFELPGGGHVNTGAMVDPQRINSKGRGPMMFLLHGTVQRKWQPEMDAIVALVRDELKQNSIYRGKAFRVEFTAPDGEQKNVQPEFVDLTPYSDETKGIYSRETEEEIEQYVYGPVGNPNAPKTGVLLSGPPGVGKTLAMSIAAYKATQAGKTVAYVNSRDFEIGLRFAGSRAPSLLIVEDIDRVLEGERDDAIDAIYNALDGPDTKHVNVSVLLTTNDLSVIPDPFLRPGRVNVTLQIEAPDADAARRLLRLYGGDAIAQVSESVLAEVGAALAGQPPAVLMGTIQRAKDSARYGRNSETVNEVDIRVAQRSMLKQVALLKARNTKATPDSERVLAARVLAEALTVKQSAVVETHGNGAAPEQMMDAEYPTVGAQVALGQ